MRMLQAQPGGEHAKFEIAPAMTAPQVLQPWSMHTEAALRHSGLLPLTNTAHAVAAAAQLQLACSSVLSGGHAGRTSPAADGFLLLLHGLIPQAAKAAALASALVQLPGTPLLWPAFGEAVQGAVPLCMHLHAVQCMLAAEQPQVYARLIDAGVLDAVAAQWLRGSLLTVLPAKLAMHVTSLAIVNGPLVLTAVVVAGLIALECQLVEQAAAAGSWVLAVKLFDVDSLALLRSARGIEARHRGSLLPCLLGHLAAGY